MIRSNIVLLSGKISCTWALFEVILGSYAVTVIGADVSARIRVLSSKIR